MLPANEKTGGIAKIPSGLVWFLKRKFYLPAASPGLDGFSESFAGVVLLGLLPAGVLPAWVSVGVLLALASAGLVPSVLASAGFVLLV